MPNWVQNEIIFENANDEKVAALIRELKLATETEESAFDFNKLIPMPESLNIESGSRTDRAIAYYVTERLSIPVEQTNLASLISNCYNNNWAAEVVSRLKKAIESGSPDEDWDKLYEMGKQYIFNREHYGCYTWYDWCCRNWGTKWNASDADWSLDSGMLVFQTALSAPFPIIQAISEKYPDLEFTHRWADEDIGSNCGSMFYSEGCGSIIESESRELAMDVWGYTDEDFDDDEGEDDDSYESSMEEMILDLEDDEDNIKEPVTIDSGLSISDLI